MTRPFDAKKQPRITHSTPLLAAKARGFTHALVSPMGHVVSVHLTEKLAKAYLCGSIRKMGCKVIPIKEALAG